MTIIFNGLLLICIDILALVPQLVIKYMVCIKHVDFFEFIELRVGEVDILVKL